MTTPNDELAGIVERDADQERGLPGIGLGYAIQAVADRRYLLGLLREAYGALAEIGCIAPSGEAATGLQCYACRLVARLAPVREALR